MTREDLILWQESFAKAYNKYPPEAYQAINETIKILQEPERKHGEWMGTVCSCCGKSTVDYYDCDFCPKCGAIMNGKEK